MWTVVLRTLSFLNVGTFDVPDYAIRYETRDGIGPVTYFTPFSVRGYRSDRTNSVAAVPVYPHDMGEPHLRVDFKD